MVLFHKLDLKATQHQLLILISPPLQLLVKRSLNSVQIIHGLLEIYNFLKYNQLKKKKLALFYIYIFIIYIYVCLVVCEPRATAAVLVGAAVQHPRGRSAASAVLVAR